MADSEHRLKYILVGTSGSGKTTMASVLEEELGLKRCITSTTRPPRPGEIDGVDYYFKSSLDPKDMFEHAPFGNYEYGISREELKRGDFVILEPQGVEYYRKHYPAPLTVIQLVRDGIQVDAERMARDTAAGFDSVNPDITVHGETIDEMAATLIAAICQTTASLSQNKEEMFPMREWLKELDDIDRDCVYQYENLLGRKLTGPEEYSEIDTQVDEMILEYSSREEFFAAYPDLIKYAEIGKRNQPDLQVSQESGFGSRPSAFRHSTEIDSLNELYDKITEVVNHILATGAENTTSGNWIVGYEDVSHLISENDFNRYFSIIAAELEGREEVLDLEADCSNGKLNFVIGLDWCPNYEPDPAEENAGLEYGTKEITKFPPLSERACDPSARAVVQVENPDRIAISCYADQVLPKTDRAELIDSYYCANFVVPRGWAEEQAKNVGYRDLDEFLNDYTWDTTDGWYEKAFQDGVLLGVSLDSPAYDEKEIGKPPIRHERELSFDEKLSMAKEAAKNQQVKAIEKPGPERV